ncbi:MAG: NAD-glutamate dehydrogenase [Sphingomonadales bacterium]|nr:NAD-glutamate dehydrogenase [Sphingomonadales bacterium]
MTRPSKTFAPGHVDRRPPAPDDRVGRHLFAFVWLPRDELTTARRVAIADMLAEAAHARLLSWTIDLGDGEVALIRYTLDLREGGKKPKVAPLHERIEMMVRGWQPAVEAALGQIGDHGHATRLALRYASAFPMAYRNGAGPEEAARHQLYQRAFRCRTTGRPLLSEQR